MGVREDFNRICLETKVEEIEKKKVKAEKLMADVFGTDCRACKIGTISDETLRDLCGLTKSPIFDWEDRLPDCPYKEYLA